MRHETVEEGFRAFVARTRGEEGRAWLAALPALHAELEGRWRLRLGRELPGGVLSSVREATLRDGTRAIVKVAEIAAARAEISALRTWAGRGAPALLAADEELGAILLERIEPGGHPASAEVTEVTALLGLLHVPPVVELPTLAAVVHGRVAAAVEAGRASVRKADWARAKIDDLTGSQTDAVLLHGDFDERNLLVCERRGLCAIDPLACSGDPAYDAGYWVHGNRRPGRRARLDAIVATSGLERTRVRDWAAVVGVHG